MVKRIGVITDVHGNLEALVAALDMLDKYKCDEILHLGDVVDIGPNSRECLETLLARKDVTCLLGNHDRDFVIDRAVLNAESHVPEAHKRQVFDSLGESLRSKAAQFPLYTTRVCGGAKLLFCHYALRNAPFDWKVFPFMPLQNEPTASKLDEIFADVRADAVFFGHKHEPCDIRGRMLYVDVGSTGCHPDPFARAVLIEYDETSWSYRRIQTPYERDAVRNRMCAETVAGEALYDYYFAHKKPT